MNEELIAGIITAILSLMVAGGVFVGFKRILSKIYSYLIEVGDVLDLSSGVIKSLAEIVHDIEVASEDHTIDEAEVKELLKDKDIVMDDIMKLVDKISKLRGKIIKK